MEINELILKKSVKRESEKGAALAISIIILALMMAVTVGVLAVSTSESGIMASDMRRTQTFYAATSSIEYVSDNFGHLFSRKARPTEADLDEIENDIPQGLADEGYKIDQFVYEDLPRLRELRIKQFNNVNDPRYPFVTIPAGSPLEGLSATISPYIVRSIAYHKNTGTQVTVQREMNNYQVPLFQFGIFGDNDVEFHPGPLFTFNGRVHSNRNLYIGGGELRIEDKITSGNEIVFGTDRNGSGRTSNVKIKAKNDWISLTQGSVSAGPHFNPSGTIGDRGFFPDSPTGSDNTGWKTTSILAPQAGVDNRFGRQVLSRSTGAAKLLLPLQLGGAPPREIIKRAMPGEVESLTESRYHNKAQVRILLDSEGVNCVACIPNTKGEPLSSFQPVPLPLDSGANGVAVYPVSATGAATIGRPMFNGTSTEKACTVRGVTSSPLAGAAGTCTVPSGAGLNGRILIEVLDKAGAWQDVTTEVLSMGVTVGEPNAIVHLQRPLWAAFIPGTRRRNLGTDLASLIETDSVADGELNITSYDGIGFASGLADEDTGVNRAREFTPPTTSTLNQIVPINVYNVREGWSEGWPSPANGTNRITERGMTSVVELNMKNLSRWLDGYYDNNLLRNTNAVSTKINRDGGYVVYVSDRRGDKLRSEYAVYDVDGNPVGAPVTTTNGVVDNEDVYSTNFDNAILDNGEDVIDFGVDPSTGLKKKGSIQKDNLDELPRPDRGKLDILQYPFTHPSTGAQNRQPNTFKILSWKNNVANDGKGYFRRAVRLFNGADLNPGFSGTNISRESGITVATENMVYIWGSYNTTGINAAPGNNSGSFNGDQIPASIVCDAFFPLSRTWFDALSVISPEGGRQADANSPGMGDETSVRAAIIAGTTMSAMAGEPDQFSGSGGESRMSGGVHNFPRFLEVWGNDRRWNYTGSLILLYYSNQAMGPYNANGVIYQPPQRNWSFDVTYLDPKRLPPGTPFFQFIQPTGFKQLIDPNPAASPSS